MLDNIFGAVLIDNRKIILIRKLKFQRYIGDVLLDNIFEIALVDQYKILKGIILVLTFLELRHRNTFFEAASTV